MGETENTVGLSDAARYLQVTRQAVYVATKTQKIKAKKINNRWSYTFKDLEEYKSRKYSRKYSRYEGELVFDKSKGEYSAVEIAEKLKIPVQKIYYATRVGLLKSKRKGSAHVIHIDDINAYEKEYLSKERKVG